MGLISIIQNIKERIHKILNRLLDILKKVD